MKKGRENSVKKRRYNKPKLKKVFFNPRLKKEGKPWETVSATACCVVVCPSLPC